jgi:hypothetical protein
VYGPAAGTKEGVVAITVSAVCPWMPFAEATITALPGAMACAMPEGLANATTELLDDHVRAAVRSLELESL